MARKILLADDSVTAQNMGRKILADAGYEVIAVNNGSAALKKIAELKPDLVILDVYMPGYSGLEVCQRLKESQETARIPVLLTVGKLEPFKPEEAQRVRAEGFIVKPFEASELLSALSKLEDKVVPRAEPSKPGRFARAIAAAEEAGRGSRSEPANDQNGWKSRIGFPHKKTEAEEKAAEEPSTYNPVNRDLRTVVETAAEKIAEKPAETLAETQEKLHQETAVAEPVVDVAALAPAGLPKDVTPEEVAAIAAAAAQIQMAAAAKNETSVSEATTASSQQSSGRVEDNPALPHAEENKSDTAAVDARHGSDEKREERQDVPVTMAATAESAIPAYSGSRWTAVPVALEGDEATLSLEQEMQKMYAAVVTEAATVPMAVSAAAEISSPPATLTVAAVTAVSSPVAEPVSQTEIAVSSGVEENAPAVTQPAASSSFATANEETTVPEPTAAPVLSAPNPQPEATVPASLAPEVAPVEASAPLRPEAQFEPSCETAAPPPESAVSAPEPAVVNPAVLAAPQANDEAGESQPSSQAESVMPEAAAVDPSSESKLDSETVKSTAAAWASWRQIRDTSKGSEGPTSQPSSSQSGEAPPKEFEIPQSVPAETAALAVAAGAEQALQEAAGASAESDPKAIASIVDSVLADLRPKLMEEISRKMAEKK